MIDYSEEDEGFLFAFKKPKRSKVVQQPVTVAEEAEEEVVKPVVVKKARKEPLQTSVAPAADQKETEPKRRRSPRNSGDGNAIELPPLEVKKRRPHATKAAKSQAQADPEKPNVRQDAAPVEILATKPQPQVPQPEPMKDVTRIALPFADTPIIRRNKEMRKAGGGDGHRRSSLGMRGRRASSLIDSGKSNGMIDYTPD